VALRARSNDDDDGGEEEERLGKVICDCNKEMRTRSQAPPMERDDDPGF